MTEVKLWSARGCGNRPDSMDIFCPGCGAATGSTFSSETLGLETPGLKQAHRDRKVRWLVALGIAALAVLTSIEIYSMWPRPDPLDTILQVREAFAHRDVSTFRQYVDEDALLSDGLNQMAGPIAKTLQKQGSAESRLLASIGTETGLRLLRPQILPQLKGLAEGAVEGAAWAEPAAGDANKSAANGRTIAVGLLRRAFDADASYVDSRVEHRSGGSAVVLVQLEIESQPETIPVRLDLHMQQGRWRIVRVRDIAQTLAQLERQK